VDIAWVVELGMKPNKKNQNDDNDTAIACGIVISDVGWCYGKCLRGIEVAFAEVEWVGPGE
jgi:hypothetical protein